MKNTDLFSALHERLMGVPKFAARADEILQVVRGKEPLRVGMPVEVTRAGGRTAPNGAEYHVRIQASTDSIARDAGIVPMSAWERGGLKNFNANPIILAFHNHREPIGMATHVELESSRMIQYWLFHQESEQSRLMKSLYEKGFMRAASVGFLVHEWQFVDEMTERELEDLIAKYGASAVKDIYWVAKRAELLETSAVPVPSDPNALAFDFAARNAEASGLDISNLARLSGRTTEQRSNTMTPEQQAAADAAAAQAAETARASAAAAAAASTSDPVTELRALFTAGINEVRTLTTKLTERVAALEARGVAPVETPVSTPADGDQSATSSEREAGVDISIDKLDGETDEQAVNRYVDEAVRKALGAPIPSTK